MTNIVKEFIELNIDNIEDGRWDTVIESWYETCSSLFFAADDEFKEFAEVLQSAGINFMTLSENARKEFMSNLIDQILHDELESASFRGSSEIKKSDVLMHIDCDLGFTENELDKIMEDGIFYILNNLNLRHNNTVEGDTAFIFCFGMSFSTV